jgi:tol-pal system protein YbgF
MIKIIRILLPVAALVLLVGCEMLMPLEEDPLYQKMTEIDTRLDRVERVTDNEGLMNLYSQLESLQQEVQNLRGDVETLQYQLDQANNRQKDLYLDLDQRLQRIETTTPGNASPGVLEGGTLGQGQLPVPGGSDRENYQAAFELIKQGRYDQAAIALNQFMVAFPASDLADNAQYWLAETDYVSKNFEAALAGFNLVLERYPESRKIPDALLKIGYCNIELERPTAAEQALRKVVGQYPDSSAARLASQRLEQLRKSSR